MAGGGGGRRGGGVRRRTNHDTGGPELVCPSVVKTSLVGPVLGTMVVGDVLGVISLEIPAPARAVCVSRASGAVVGSIGGIPGIATLVDCINAGISYEALVDAIIGGRVDVTIRRM